jgi:hypothetical protein
MKGDRSPAFISSAFGCMQFSFRKPEQQVYLESLILAQIERWRHA